MSEIVGKKVKVVRYPASAKIKVGMVGTVKSVSSSNGCPIFVKFEELDHVFNFFEYELRFLNNRRVEL